MSGQLEGGLLAQVNQIHLNIEKEQKSRDFEHGLDVGEHAKDPELQGDRVDELEQVGVVLPRHFVGDVHIQDSAALWALLLRLNVWLWG